MRRSTVALVAAVMALGLAPAGAGAHPLGNFSINHLSQVGIAADRVDVRYILDQAEIPTFQERGTPPGMLLARKTAEIQRGLALTVGGRRVALRALAGARISFPPGQGGLKLTRVELRLAAPVRTPARVALRDETYLGRVGWKAIVARPAPGTAVRSSAPSGDPTGGLRHYPQDLLSSPLDERSATFAVRAGSGTLSAPAGAGRRAATTTNRSGDGFAGVFENAAAGQGVLVFLLLAALAWGAIHALSPGHGKTMVAAYLVGTRGTPRQALLLGLSVTISHTVGVFALGLVTLALSQYVLPEQLYPWLTLVSGLLVVVIGLGVMRGRVRSWYAARKGHGAGQHGHADHQHGHDHPAPGSDHGHSHDEDHPHGPDSDHGHSHDHPDGSDHSHDSDHGHSHGGRHHHHALPERLSGRALIAMGASAGLIPCPSALVVLLGALAQHQVALGLLLILAFSTGLALTLSGLGLLVVSASRVTMRFNLSSGLVSALPAVSAVVIVAAGCALTVRALPGVL